MDADSTVLVQHEVIAGAHLGTGGLSVQSPRQTRANLVLLDANPLESIANTSRIAGVVMGGRWIPKAEIDKRLAEMRNRSRGPV